MICDTKTRTQIECFDPGGGGGKRKKLGVTAGGGGGGQDDEAGCKMRGPTICFALISYSLLK